MILAPTRPRPLLCGLLILLSIAAAAPAAPPAEAPARIVSLAPSLTDLLFDLGVGDRVVGVTDWCVPPPERADLTRVGGHVNPNLEAVVALRPDLVVVEAANGEVVEGLRALGIRTCVVDHKRIAGILDSVSVVGEACGATGRAKALRAELDARLAAVTARRSGGPRPRAMIVVGRDVSHGRLGDLYLAGGGTFLGEMLSLAGGENVMTGHAVNYPLISLEGLLALAPEVVIDLAPECADDPRKRAELEAAWRGLPDVPAVRDGRVHVRVDAAMLVPGPRFVDTLEWLATVLNPE